MVSWYNRKIFFWSQPLLLSAPLPLGMDSCPYFETWSNLAESVDYGEPRVD